MINYLVKTTIPVRTEHGNYYPLLINDSVELVRTLNTVWILRLSLNKGHVDLVVPIKYTCLPYMERMEQ